MADDKKTVSPEKAAADLISELSQEVFEQSGGDRYRSGQPLANDPTAQHDAEGKARKAAAKEKPAEDEPTSSEGGELILGKWKTQEEAQKGIHNLIQHAKSALERADQSEARQAELEKKVVALEKLASANGGDPESDDPFDQLESKAYVPKELLSKAIQKGVADVLQELARPTLEAQKADKEILEEYPDYGEKVKDIIDFLHKHPAVLRDVQYAEGKGEYLLARKYAYTLFTAQQKAVKEAVGEGKTKARADKVAETKPDAAMLGSTRSDGRIKQPASEALDWPDSDRFEYLKGMAKRGHPDLLWRETIGRMLENDPTFPK